MLIAAGWLITLWVPAEEGDGAEAALFDARSGTENGRHGGGWDVLVGEPKVLVSLGHGGRGLVEESAARNVLHVNALTYATLAPSADATQKRAYFHIFFLLAREEALLIVVVARTREGNTILDNGLPVSHVYIAPSPLVLRRGGGGACFLFVANVLRGCQEALKHWERVRRVGIFLRSQDVRGRREPWPARTG